MFCLFWADPGQQWDWLEFYSTRKAESAHLEAIVTAGGRAGKARPRPLPIIMVCPCFLLAYNTLLIQTIFNA